MLFELRLDEPSGVEIPRQGEHDAVGQAESEHRKDDDRHDLKIGRVGPERVDAPCQDERLDGFPERNNYVECKDDRQMPPERRRELGEPRDEAWYFLGPFG